MVRILQITDTHLVAPGRLVANTLDTKAALDQAVVDIQAAMPKLGQVDALLITGDLSDDGSAESYAMLRKALAPLGLPVLAIPGNHDLRDPMRAAFADLDLFADNGRLNWIKDIGPLRLVGIDTLVEGSGGGVIDQETADFLGKALAFDGPILLAMHHPPFASGIRFMDDIGLAGNDLLAQCLAASPAEIRIICGHLHMMSAGMIAGATAIVCPSTCSSFDIDFRPDAPVGFFPGGGGFMVHDWAGSFRSTHIASVRNSLPIPF